MMRFIFFLLFSTLFLPLLPAQAKYDYNWTLGYRKKHQSPSTGIKQGGMVMRFDSIPIFVDYPGFKCHDPSACISDRQGNLVAYTDGCSVYNKQHEQMLNGGKLNPGFVYQSNCPVLSYPLYQGALFLPAPNQERFFYLMHLRKDNQFWNPMNLLYTLVDADGDGGNGAVVAKNVELLSDSFYLADYVTATRHANDRDWWVIVPQRYKNGMHITLITPTGPSYRGIQNIGEPIMGDAQTHGDGQATFSADGSKYFRNVGLGLQMLDFDRCAGVFSNPQFWPYDSAFSAWGGVVTSPNSRYLYLLASTRVYQFDLRAADVFMSRQTVGIYQYMPSPFNTPFFQAQRGPDGKIYATSGSTNDILHVIHNPDEPGLACNVEQNGFKLPAITSYIMPNIANYRLGPTSTPCDSTMSALPSVPQEPAGLDVYPNPADDEATFEQLGHYAGQGGSLRVSDLAGRLLWERAFQPGEPVLRWPVGGVSAGVYVWEYVRADGRRAAGRVAVQR